MEVEIISTTCIKPSSPLPPHLHTFKLSIFDQSGSSVYWTSILFYRNSQETNERSQLLKQSLSETLSRFYPVAGKYKDNLSIDCTDAGVPYINAQCNISLSQFLARPDLEALGKLMPDATSDELPSGAPVCLIRETTFACGGLAIGVNFSHIIWDGYSGILFLKEWAATTRKVAETYPFLGVESIFPQRTAFPREKGVGSVLDSFAKTGNFITKRIVFEGSAIANLKEKASSNNIKNPTRSEIVTSFLVKCLMKSFKNKTGNDQPLATTIVVNLRRKGELPLLEYSLGNVICLAGTVFTSMEKKKELHEIVNQLREAVGKVDNEFMESIQSDEDGLFRYYDTLKKILHSHDAPEYATFSNICSFGIYDIDFGWGRPIWVVFFPWFQHNPDKPNFNNIFLMDTRTGRGVEAWVTLLQESFDILGKDSELLQYASIDPSPLYNSFEPTSKL